MNKQALLFVGLPMVAVLALGGIHIYQMLMYPTWFSHISLRDSEEAVRGKMGSPTEVVKSPPFWCKDSGIVSEFMYGASIPPEWWVVGFDSQGRVICTTYLISP
jgi:hypothetical protein